MATGGLVRILLNYDYMAELEKELKESIAYFEQILSVLPGERTALEFLSVASSQLGDEKKALGYALTLAESVLREKDVKDAAPVIERLKNFDDSRAKAMILKLQVLVAPPAELKFERVSMGETCATPAIAAKAELKLLKRLVDDGVLHASLVRNAFDQLENLPTSQVDFLISALLILEKENLSGASDALVAVADAAHAPPISLDAFDIPPPYVRKLPEKLVKVRGVVPFAKIGSDWAVAVLNPLDDSLRIEVTESLGARCHFFLAVPATIEKALERVFRAEQEELELEGAALPPPEQQAEPIAAEPIAAEPPPAVNPIR